MAEECLIAPVVPEPITLIGPSVLKVDRGQGGEQYEASVWVGGEGLAADGRWGHVFQFSFTLPFDSGITHVAAHAGHLLMTRYRGQVVRLYGEEIAAAIMCAVTQVINGYAYRRPYTVEEIMKDMR